MLLFVSSMVLGVAALVSINSFGDNLKASIDKEARTLLGADLSFESSTPFPDPIEALIDSIGGVQSRRTSFASMALFPKTSEARLATVRAHEPGYPFYGSVVTDPPSAADAYLETGGALVDGTLMNQFSVTVGDTVRIGTVSYPVMGRLLETPRESGAAMLFSPRIYIPLARVDTTLLVAGSQVDYEIYFRFDDGRDVEALRDSLETTLREARIGSDTVQEEQRSWDRGLTNLYRFLGLIGFMALLLGSLGVASSVHVYIRQRIATVAVLRCFGASSWSTVAVYILQSFGMGLVGALLGSLVGVGIQTLIPRVLTDFLPVDVTFSISWSAVLLGSGIGIGVTMLFSILPLLTVRSVSPMDALRSGSSAGGRGGRDGLWWGAVSIMAAGLTAFAVLQAPSVGIGLAYAGVLGVVFLLLTGTSHVLMRSLVKFTPVGLPYVVRQGISNLYRPNNQTLMMVLALGLGSFLIAVMLISERVLLSQIEVGNQEGRPNLVLFDIQPAQVEGVAAELSGLDVPVLSETPVISMRIHAIGDRTVDELRADSTFDTSWAHRREYRSTYRSVLTDAETVLEGSFTGSFTATDEPVPVSVESDVASELRIGIGDRVVFNVQGVMIETVIGSIRAVDWRRLQTNFFFVFPDGPLDNAPAFHVITARTSSEEQAAEALSTLARSYPNVSSIDLSLVLSVFDAIFSRISFVIRFMALFSILTGLIVLAGAVFVSRFQRMEESVLLKTLGASRRTVLRIMAVEYAVLGLVAASTGIVLASGAGWALARFVFETPFVVAPLPVLALLGGVITLTLLIGLLNSRGVYDKSALDVLRNDT
jgi:putative ABC transport system permease protein